MVCGSRLLLRVLPQRLVNTLDIKLRPDEPTGDTCPPQLWVLKSSRLQVQHAHGVVPVLVVPVEAELMATGRLPGWAAPLRWACAPRVQDICVGNLAGCTPLGPAGRVCHIFKA